MFADVSPLAPSSKDEAHVLSSSSLSSQSSSSCLDHLSLFPHCLPHTHHHFSILIITSPSLSPCLLFLPIAFPAATSSITLIFPSFSSPQFPIYPDPFPVALLAFPNSDRASLEHIQEPYLHLTSRLLSGFRVLLGCSLGILELDAIYKCVTSSSLVKTTRLLSRMSWRPLKKRQCLPNIYSSKCTCGTLPCLVTH